ncbi:hypothetical protein BAUCODRAFT_38175 [Baudoinia panamericana UAMH 10762]|uniref:Uncharacterized protein n=1 Tax=Baudoinia panamericana (strain UAMH 10762) TaxID=717646 RepID=M2ML93_BAUPA|nr:uncharacterized protein BAUCODRAFT_38175 [Baudoinia panamericana UAMH 10762]EMC92148.1 hypothetical protein BAUCODRAFT_38175 [Baudoinia panamericana UAMH 10762]
MGHGVKRCPKPVPEEPEEDAQRGSAGAGGDGGWASNTAGPSYGEGEAATASAGGW